jgi:hypothetical protein
MTIYYIEVARDAWEGWRVIMGGSGIGVGVGNISAEI